MYQSLSSMPRSFKIAFYIGLDCFLILFSLYLAFALRFGVVAPPRQLYEAWPLFPSLLIGGTCVVLFLRLHRIKLGTFEIRAIQRYAVCAVVLTLLAMSVSYLANLNAPRSVPIIFGILFFLTTTGSRIAGQQFLLSLRDLENRRASVIVYGAGSAGIQLVSALREDWETRVVALCDDNPGLHGLMISGLPVVAPKKLEALVKAEGVDRILVALPSASTQRRKGIIAQLSALPCEVLALPSYADMIEGKGLTDSLRPVRADDLLERDSVSLDTPDVVQTYAGRSVLVTGAGGSIGSELCRQIMKSEARALILFDNSEYALYTLERELAPTAAQARIALHAVLGSVCNRGELDAALTGHGVDVVLHAAAYKHVPLVEGNELAGVRNNIFGTLTAAEAARDAGVGRFILISTDKAVKPTSIMGATKRIAEMVIQDLQTRCPGIHFSLVRFGNVLGSSGSVIPLFREQIATGGPITLTHPEVTRYFMTTPEAARLVLLAGAYSEGGDVFLLDMGKPVRIRDLAYKMVSLSGLSVRDAANPDGDIEIRVTGLRPGEKLYEDLLINAETFPTRHEKILRAVEHHLSEFETAALLRAVTKATEANDVETVRELIAKQVEGYSCPERDRLLTNEP